MSTNDLGSIFIHNPYQNAGQATLDGFPNNLPCWGASENPVTVEMFNAKIGSSREMAQRISAAEDEDEAIFGTHLREAATTLRKIFGSR